jgi:hypothetical protein
VTKSTVHQESFLRWQAITIAQLGYVINLLLAFATASLGFGFSFVKEPTFCPNCLVRVVFGLALLLLLSSVVVGLWCTNNRLKDFRKTKDIARDREKWYREQANFTDIDARLARRREGVNGLGEKTWHLFYGQIWCFLIGALLLILSLSAAYWEKI